MRMLRWILGLTLRDRKRNDDIRRILGVACITDKVREARLSYIYVSYSIRSVIKLSDKQVLKS